MDHIDHIAIQVSNINRAINWYCKKFNTEILYQDDTWALLDFDNIKLALVIPDQHPPHLALKRDDAESFGKLTRHRDNTSSTYINDSEGNVVEIMLSNS